MTELIFENLDYDPLVVEAIRNLRSGYCACGINRIYRILDSSKSYRITVPASAPVKERLFHDIVRLMLITNLLSELFNGPAMNLKVYDALEDVKIDMINLCEDYVDYFNCKLLTKPEHTKCIEIFTLTMEALASEERIDVVKTFELLGIQ